MVRLAPGIWLRIASAIVIGVVGSVLATYGGQALGFYQVGETAGFIGSVFGAIVLIVLLRLLGDR